MNIELKKLKHHKLNHDLYGEREDDDELLESMELVKQLEAITLAADGVTIISGHRRVRCAKKLGWSTIEAIIRKDLKEDSYVREAIIHSNRYRDKTVEQKAREYQELERIYAERQKSDKDERSDDKAAEEVGLGSRDTARKAIAVVDQIDALEDRGHTKKAEELRTKLNEQSVHSAHQDAVFESLPRSAKQMIKDDPSIASSSAIKKLSKMEPGDAFDVCRSVRVGTFKTFDAALKGKSGANGQTKKTAKSKKKKDATPKDKHGRELPNKTMIDLFADQRFTELEKKLASALSDLMKIRGGKAQYLEVTSIRDHLKESIEKVKNAKPFALCPECDGKGCKWCRKSGWMPAWVYEDYLMKKR